MSSAVSAKSTCKRMTLNGLPPRRSNDFYTSEKKMRVPMLEEKATDMLYQPYG